jgi:hypothetical protein
MVLISKIPVICENLDILWVGFRVRSGMIVRLGLRLGERQSECETHLTVRSSLHDDPLGEIKRAHDLHASFLRLKHWGGECG